MSKDNICVSAFGFKDVICINGQVYIVPESVPSVIIEDSDNKFNMYSYDAIFERTGMGLNQLDDHKSRIPVCFLWQQLKQFDYGAQYDAAKRLSKYVLSLIIHAYSELGIKSESNNPINKSYLRSNTQITLCIPDFFDESEQQCLLDAFNGFDFRLLWRSIAAIMGSFHEEKPQLDKSSNNMQITVFYLGPDSCDVTSYDYQAESDGYITPIRRVPVYSNCSLATNYSTIAASNAAHFLKGYLDSHNNLSHDLQMSVLSQLFFKSSFIWLEQADEGINACEALCINTGKSNHWLVFDSRSVDFNYFLYNVPRFDIAEMFINDYNLVGANQYQAFTSDKLQDSLKQQLFNLLANHQQKRDYIIFTGPFAFNLLSQTFFEIMPPNYQSCTCMATGGHLFTERMNQDLPTYLDRMRKLSMISRNEYNEYIEKVLISAATVKPSNTFRSTPIRQRITAGAEGIALYISSDEKFNDATINQAKYVSFIDQNIEVYAAKLPFKSGAKADKDENVYVTVEQKVLSGYVKIIIKPEGESNVLPKFGLTAAFDPNTKKLYEGLLTMLNNSYPDLVRPNLYSGPEINRQIERNNLVFSSNNNRAEVLYYNNEFAYEGLKPKIYETINRQISDLWPLLALPQTIDSLLQVLTKVDNNNFLTLSCTELLSNDQYMAMVNYFDQAVCYFFKKPHIGDSLPKALRLYSRMIPDEPSYCRRCADMYGEFSKIDSRRIDCQVLSDIRVFIENHPQSFSANDNNFAMTNSLSLTLLHGSCNTLYKVLRQQSALNSTAILANQRIIGSLNLSSSLAAIMYALLWRKMDKAFLGTYDSVCQLLSMLAETQNKLSLLRDSLTNCDINNKIFEQNLKRFVAATPITINDVIDYLQNRGTNTNIMASIDEVNQEK